MNKRELSKSIQALKIKMMDRDSAVCTFLKQIAVQDRDIYIEFQRLENAMKDK